jgi:hypothetical protein
MAVFGFIVQLKVEWLDRVAFRASDWLGRLLASQWKRLKLTNNCHTRLDLAET